MSKQTNQFTFNKNESQRIWEEWCESQNLKPLVVYEKSQQPFYFEFMEGKFKGLIGRTYWASIKRGSKMRLSCLTHESATKYMRRLGEKVGIEFPNEYVGKRKEKNYFKVSEGKYKGCEGYITLNDLENLKSIDSRSLSEEGKKYYFDKKAKERDCIILEYPESYKIKFSKQQMVVLDNKGVIHHLWVQDFFERDSILEMGWSSEGEKIIIEILNEMEIEYKREKAFINRVGNRQRFDFYIELNDKVYIIEYNGRQHYEELSSDFFGKFEDIKYRDELKREYCNLNNFKLLEIPYTVSSKKDISKVIVEYLQNP